jgi:hypothetical protein
MITAAFGDDRWSGVFSGSEDRKMTKWKNTITVVGVALAMLLAWGCGMAETSVFQPKLVNGMKEVPASEDSEKLDAEALAFFRDQFSIDSARYYQVPAEIPWIAVSKSVQNQMAELSIQRTMFEWYEPGIDFIEVYPQGNDASAFAVAMPKGTNPSADKLVGFYGLSAPATAQ